MDLASPMSPSPVSLGLQSGLNMALFHFVHEVCRL